MKTHFSMGLALMALACCNRWSSAQSGAQAPVATLEAPRAAQASSPDQPPATAPSITLDEAVRRARLLDHNYVSAVVDKGTADANQTIARAALLPNVDFHNQATYTQPQRPYTNAGTVDSSIAPVFIANNAVREYVSQGVVTESIGVAQVASLRQADAERAAAKARLEIARRGLVATVVGAFYGVAVAEEQQRIATLALDEANRFLKLSGQLENGGEVAHADVLKASLQQQQSERSKQDADLAAGHARLELGVLLFADPATPYTLAVDLDHPPTLATQPELEVTAKSANPDVRAALASLRAAELGVTASVGGYLPTISVAYNYGIDADHFSATDASGIRNLGYAVTGTIDIPVWDWMATRAKVKQAQLQRNLAQADLTLAQRRLLATFREYYAEATTAQLQLVSLARSVSDAAEALRLTTLRYSNGEGSALEVVDAQSTLVTARTNRANGVARYYTALANLQTMTGNMP